MDKITGVTFGIEAGINIAVSGALNALCAWLLYRGATAVPVDFWSLFVDTTITCFLVSVITAAFATASARRYAARGMRVSVGGFLAKGLASLPTAAIPMGCCLFGMSLPVLVAVFGVAFGACGLGALAVFQFMAFKGLWGGLYGAIVCVVILTRHLMAEGGGHV